jgi:uncharacterized protein
MKIAISGATGLVGQQLGESIRKQGDDVLVVSRSGGGENTLVWDPAGGKLDPSKLSGVDAFVHLAGESIADGRWTEAKKARIRESRVSGTRLVAEALASLSDGPKTLIAASAIGFYGDRGAEVCQESDSPGTGFLPDVCVAWEAATAPAEAAGIRVVKLRIGVVLSPKGGALAKMLPPFRLGAGGVIGSGRQYFSWVALDDLIPIIQFALTNATLSGPVNAVAPQAVTNHEYTKTLGKVLGRPTVFPMPAFAARLAFGEMADALLLASARVVPEKLKEAGYVFQYPELEPALRAMLR